MSDFQITSGHVGLYVLLPGDELQVMDGGQSFGSIVGLDSKEVVAAGGESHADHILAGGVLQLATGATAVADTVDHGALVQGGGRIVDGLADYGTVNGVTVKAGAGSTDKDVLADFGRAINVGIAAGGEVSVLGVAARDKVYSGGVEAVQSHGVSVLATVYAGGSLTLDEHAVAKNVTLATGGSEQAAAGSAERGARVMSGATLTGAETLGGLITDAGSISGGTLIHGGKLEVTGHGVATGVLVASGATLDIAAGASAQNVSLRAGAALIDDGTLTVTAAATQTLAGALSGSGSIVMDGSGALREAGDAAGFTGRTTIDQGTVLLANVGGDGRGSIAFEAKTAAATLVVEGAASPANGATLSQSLVDFDSANDRVDLRNRAFAAGATATVSGSTLTLKDGGYTARFDLGGTHAAAYVVGKDADGGTVIRARAGGASALVQAAAAFGGGDASAGALNASRTTVDPFSAALAVSAPTRASHA